MPTSVTDEPLGLHCVFSDGSTAAFDLAGLPNSRLARDLAIGLVELIHPHGSADTAGTVDAYAGALRAMVRRLAEQGFTGGAADLRRGKLAQFWMAGPRRLEALTRSLVEGYARSGGCLADGVLELAVGRHFNIQPYRRPLPPYPDSEWHRLTETCQRLVDESYTTHHRALATKVPADHSVRQGWAYENFCWLVGQLGPVRTPEAAHAMGLTYSAFQNRRLPDYYAAVEAMFPHLDVVIAYRLLFGVYSGIVPDGIADLDVGDIDWAGDATVLLSYVKRRTAAESVNLPRPAVRLLEQWLSHSALLRSWVEPAYRDRLWLGLSKVGRPEPIREINREAIKRWVRRHGLRGEDGGLVKIHRSRIRTTHHAMREKRNWTGNARATIDPNHTPAVEGDHYLSATTPGQRHAIETVVEDAQHDLLRRAHPPTVITEQDAAALARDYPQLVTAMRLDDRAVVELVGGARDVFTAACGDQLAGLHGPVGKPCPARPWVCLLCPLAVFAPRHAVNLLRLKAFFSRQWQQMPAAHFMAVFGPYATRIDQILSRFDPGELTAAASLVADTDDEIPLRPEELTA
ncbi:hypothetical protein [Nocardia terpenica]|uniref:Uncharacterized protein n=1 Tax=Nocardia terpenica TaxID=455432 RepID=A0A161WDI6_9NOCA|nr:hypothetical protein [Nocardia terpenica]KZM75009.1 hypothetical protein AWN90_23705 [Nocardia terpenica]NQE93318.1 hypothetical protein [Nocardia terpenica]